ncbi:restriction endonuclease [Pedobacter paludis]|nr:restriction endonuclease [Pedobacter paludis]
MTNANELNWKEYEAITQYIYGALGAGDGVKVKGYGHNCKVKGRSGVEHQIDVLTEQVDGKRILLTAIECKYAKKKVTKDVVMKLSKVMEDSQIDCGIIVCKAGFTMDTQTFAEHVGIKLVELREAGKSDEEYKKTMEIGTVVFNFDIRHTRPKITRIDFGTRTIEHRDQIRVMSSINLRNSHGDWISFGKFVSAFSKELQKREESTQPTTIDFPLNFKLYCEFPEGRMGADWISITGILTHSDESFKKSFRLTDQVWMIMNELFDQRKLTLSKSGLIWNLPSTS